MAPGAHHLGSAEQSLERSASTNTDSPQLPQPPVSARAHFRLTGCVNRRTPQASVCPSGTPGRQRAPTAVNAHRRPSTRTDGRQRAPTAVNAHRRPSTRTNGYQCGPPDNNTGYLVKILIRGDRNTGKTTLWHRLQGKKFVEQYIPTQEIQVTSIHWSYKTTDDIVKVEVWDIVDKGHTFLLPATLGKSRKKGDGLKLENDPQESEAELALDAEFLDVYKNCNGVIMMFDITKQWTFSYIMKELPKVPDHIPVCVLGNHRDMGEHRVILPDDVRDFIQSSNRLPRSSYIRYAESSMRNGFGLKYLHKFFNIPFLQLQRETLLRQLETNQLDIDATLEELSVQHETEDQNYELFLELMDTKNRGFNSSLATNGQSPSSGSQSPVVPPSSASTASSSPATPQPPVQTPRPPSASPPPPSVSPPAELGPAPEIQSATVSVPPPSPSLSPSPSPSPSPSTLAAPVNHKRSFISRLFGSSSTPEAPATKPDAAHLISPEGDVKAQSVDDFVPEDGLDKSFLEDTMPQKERTRGAGQESDSDGERRGNPMVAGFQDDLDLDDQVLQKPSVKSQVPSKDITLSSDEDEGAKVTVRQDPSKRASKSLLKSQDRSPTKATVQDPGTSSSPPVQPEQLSSRNTASCLPGNTSLTCTPSLASPLAPVPAPAPAPLHKTESKGQNKSKTQECKESSESDAEGPIAKQLLSFVMDDPDFESDDSDKRPKIEVFPVREDSSELSNDDFSLAKLTMPMKPQAWAVKPANDLDLFGLGIDNKSPAVPESSDEEKASKGSSKEKKKKKKKVKEEDEKSEKKRHKPKKVKEKEKEGTAEEGPRREKETATEEKRRKKKVKSKDKAEEDMDDLEMFLIGSGDSHVVKSRGSGEYEEL
ncbi:rab-like protein 6 [Heptranchias perlo]|uniref:rab-like protein 6 n=1 Tax=Heptranchias perlo TaxID=212740 RepID=UPI00355AA4B9